MTADADDSPRVDRRTLLSASAALALFAAVGVDVTAGEKAIAATSNVLSFYAQSRWGSRFGVIDYAHPTYVHRGLDIFASGRQAIPILRSGTVASIDSSSVYGNYMFVRVTSSDHDFYAHQYAISASVGQTVSQGDYVSQAATWGDVHGTGWRGPHLHLGNFASVGNPESMVARNPEPVVLSVLTGGSVPVSLATTKDKNMIFLRYTSSAPNIWIALDLVNKKYRLIPAGGFEDQLLTSMVVSGELDQHNIADPVWGQTFGNGQFTQVP